MKPRILEFGQACKYHQMCGKTFTLSSDDILDFVSIVQILPLQCHKKSKQKCTVQASNKLHNNISLTLLRNGEQKKHRLVIIYCTIRNSSNDSCMLTFNSNLFRPVQASLLVIQSGRKNGTLVVMTLVMPFANSVNNDMPSCLEFVFRPSPDFTNNLKGIALNFST